MELAANQLKLSPGRGEHSWRRPYKTIFNSEPPKPRYQLELVTRGNSFWAKAQLQTLTRGNSFWAKAQLQTFIRLRFGETGFG
jgi:hypothetical protein